MPADLITRLLLKNDDFDRRLKQSGTQVQTFEKGIGTLKSGVLAFAGGIGVAMTAGEAFNRVINSSQTLSDEYNRTLAGLGGVVDNLFYSISNGDWSPFLQGLSNSIALAREAYTALDQLGNTRMSYGYFNMKNQAGLQDQIAILRDKNSTEEQKNIARAEANRILADQKEITEQLGRRAEDAMLALVKKSTGLADLDVSQMDIEKAFRLDVSAMGDAEKERLDALYSDFEKRADALRKQNSKTQTVYSGIGGFRIETVVDQDKLKEALKPLLAQYQDAILYNSTLVKESDEWLHNLMNIGQEAFVAERAYSSMVKSSNRASQSGTGGASGGDKDKKRIEYLSFIQFSENNLQQQVDDALYPKVQTMLANKKFDFQIYLHANEEQIEAEINDLSGSLIDLENKIAAAENAYKYATNDKQRNAIAAQLKKLQADKSLIKPLVTNTDVTNNNDYAESLQAIGSVMGSVTNLTKEGSAAWLSYSTNLLSAVGAAIPAINSLVIARKSEANANAEAGVTGAIASVSSIPIVGWIMALSAGAAVISAMASIPKFATGGIAGSGIIPGSLVSGDRIPIMVNAGEMILNQAQQGNLFRMINEGGNGRSNVNVVGEVRISGDQMRVLLSNADKVRRRGL